MNRLRPHFRGGEATWLTRMIFEHLLGYSPVDMAIKADNPVSDYMHQKISGIVDRLLKGQPIQYIFGEASFYGLKMKVTPATLIPRPETEELVDMIVRDADKKPDLKVFDICTGSGCIAIALARNLNFPIVDATDISTDALRIATENIRTLRVKVNAFQSNALDLDEAVDKYDIIVSNPPYIAESERATMERNVLDHEPSLALFVPDTDPLMFYTAICRYASKALSSQGRLYFELNPLFAEQLASQMKAEGWQEVQLHRDMQGSLRFLSATRRES